MNRAKEIYITIWGIALLAVLFLIGPGIAGGVDQGNLHPLAAWLLIVGLLAALAVTAPVEELR